MLFERQVSQALHTEHLASIELLGRLEQTIARAKSHQVEGLDRLATEFSRWLEQDIERHFVFEENELFTRLSDAGEGDIATLLKEEHEAIRAAAGELRPLAAAASGGTLEAAQWSDFRRLALEMVERQVAHIQKETMALLPMLDDLLDEDDDRELAMAYASA